MTQLNLYYPSTELLGNTVIYDGNYCDRLQLNLWQFIVCVHFLKIPTKKTYRLTILRRCWNQWIPKFFFFSKCQQSTFLHKILKKSNLFQDTQFKDRLYQHLSFEKHLYKNSWENIVFVFFFETRVKYKKKYIYSV